jgi:hypothetical protein
MVRRVSSQKPEGICHRHNMPSGHRRLKWEMRFMRNAHLPKPRGIVLISVRYLWSNSKPNWWKATVE